MAKNKDFDGIQQELPLLDLPKVKLLHFELLDVENLLQYELEYQLDS